MHVNVYVVVRELGEGVCGMTEFTFQNDFCYHRRESGMGRGRRRDLSGPAFREKMTMI